MNHFILHLEKGYTLINNDDFDIIAQYKKWRQLPSGYVASHIYDSSIKKVVKTVYMHRLIMGVSDSTIPYIDHKNRIKFDNRRENLRLATPQESARNRQSGYGRSKYIGVGYTSRITNGKKYEYICAKINIDKRPIYLGIYKTEEEAALAYNAAAIKYFGEFANLNTV